MVSNATEPNLFTGPAGGQMELQLQPVGAEFKLLRRFQYHDPGQDNATFTIPGDLEVFRTDLASIPWFFAWLVPGLGTHLPAVLVHDALVGGTLGTDYDGPTVNREEADRILRDAMANLGTPPIRRWLMWTAVTMPTALFTLTPRWRWWLAVVGTLLTIVVLGTLATLDVFDVWNVLPWMGERPWWAEVLLGAAGALVTPLVLAMLWGRLWRAGAIAGIALALLLHVTLAVLLVGATYWVLEWFASGRQGAKPSARTNLENATSPE